MHLFENEKLKNIYVYLQSIIRLNIRKHEITLDFEN